eukprot:1177236-Prorocentrum_minimum.AAC.1
MEGVWYRRFNGVDIPDQKETDRKLKEATLKAEQEEEEKRSEFKFKFSNKKKKPETEVSSARVTMGSRLRNAPASPRIGSRCVDTPSCIGGCVDDTPSCIGGCVFAGGGVRAGVRDRSSRASGPARGVGRYCRPARQVPEYRAQGARGALPLVSTSPPLVSTSPPPRPAPPNRTGAGAAAAAGVHRGRGPGRERHPRAACQAGHLPPGPRPAAQGGRRQGQGQVRQGEAGAGAHAAGGAPPAPRSEKVRGAPRRAAGAGDAGGGGGAAGAVGRIVVVVQDGRAGAERRR